MAWLGCSREAVLACRRHRCSKRHSARFWFLNTPVELKSCARELNPNQGSDGSKAGRQDSHLSLISVMVSSSFRRFERFGYGIARSHTAAGSLDRLPPRPTLSTGLQTNSSWLYFDLPLCATAHPSQEFNSAQIGNSGACLMAERAPHKQASQSEEPFLIRIGLPSLFAQRVPDLEHSR